MKKYVLGELFFIVLTGALGGALAWLCAKHIFPVVGPGLATELYVCFAAPLLLFLFLAAATLFVGLSSYYTNDADREWLARGGAWILIAIAVRMAFGHPVIFGWLLVLWSAYWVLSSIGGIFRPDHTPARAELQDQGPAGSAAEGEAGQDLDPLGQASGPGGAGVFAVFILVILSLGTTVLVRWLTEGSAGLLLAHDQRSLRRRLLVAFEHRLPLPLEGRLRGARRPSRLLGLTMGYFVDINRFSLHASYRDRLIRAYMGASRGSRRRPNPFTGLDDHDNVQMKSLRGNRPFHVVNMALNLVGGKELAWQDRKAETFTASPLHAVSFRLGYRDVAEYGLHRDQGRSLPGTAMAISGAAASPNMGYHSSPVVTFLLALFNVRLGWWLGNPRPSAAGPTPPRVPASHPGLFAEAFGLTDGRRPYVYLSDGGHFENLGLYEMVLRRCRFIVVSYGGEGRESTSRILATPCRRSGRSRRTDQVRQDPDAPAAPGPGELRLDAVPGRAALLGAIARICYSCVHSARGGKVEDGLLLYVKPSMNGTEPADVFHYARLHPLFPHEPTSHELTRSRSSRAIASWARTSWRRSSDSFPRAKRWKTCWK